MPGAMTYTAWQPGEDPAGRAGKLIQDGGALRDKMASQARGTLAKSSVGWQLSRLR